MRDARAPNPPAGHLTADTEYENLYNVTACDEHTTFGFDFEFNDTTAFDVENDSMPRMQMAFCYCRRKPGSGRPQKRLRVDTQLISVARSAQELFEYTNVDVVSLSQSLSGKRNRIKPNQIGSNRIKPNQINSHQIESIRIKSNQIKPNRIKANRIESNRTNSNQIDSNQIKSNQIESNRIESNKIESN